MANEIKLAEGIDKNHRVVFKGSGGKHVSEMDQAQLETLAQIGLESNNKNILSLFQKDTLPTLDELKKKKVNTEVKAIPPAGAANTNAANTTRPAGTGQGQ